MKIGPMRTIRVCVGASALIATVGLSLPALEVSNVRAAPAGPALFSPPPPSPTPPPTSQGPSPVQEPEYNLGADGGGGGGGGG
jgi:hypothetical protein